MSVLVFGHKNPDTDAIASAIALAYLKQQQCIDAIPCRLGELNPETSFVLEYFKQEIPIYIEDVKTQVMDINYDHIAPANPYDSVLDTFQAMLESGFRTKAIVDTNQILLGVVTMQDIALSLITGDIYHIETSNNLLVSGLLAKYSKFSQDNFLGKVIVIAYFYETIKFLELIQKDSIVIVGDRFDVIELAIKQKAALIIVTGGIEVPSKLLKKAYKNKVSILVTEFDTYTTAKKITQCNFIKTIADNKKIRTFIETDYIEVALEEIKSTNFSNYPIVDKNYKYLGLISRRNILLSSGKKVILVDHNEYMQTVSGIKQADIIEIIDHHKIGDIATANPIAFRNQPTGSTCTIVYSLYKEQNMQLTFTIAGLLASGIISDTLLLTSPTTTELDRQSLNELKNILNLENLDEYAYKMFKAGTSIHNLTIQEIFFRDFKLFEVGGKTLGIAQILTLDIEGIRNRELELEQFIHELHLRKKYFLTMLVVTDIVSKGSYLYFHCENKNLLPLTFEQDIVQGTFVENIVSRKKQIVPKMMNIIINM
ncbi:MAG: putative manganese-dependent inorganic diphosphatase [Clostridia bacterium]